jgi:hypothetical protein
LSEEIGDDVVGSSEPGSRAAGFMAIATQDGSSDFRLERDLIVLPAIVTNYLISLRCSITLTRFF